MVSFFFSNVLVNICCSWFQTEFYIMLSLGGFQGHQMLGSEKMFMPSVLDGCLAC